MFERKESQLKVLEEISDGSWVIESNYSSVRLAILKRASYAIILNFPLLLIFWRIFIRTFARRVNFLVRYVTPLPKNIIASHSKEKIFESLFVLWKQTIRFKIKNYKEILWHVEKHLGKKYIILKNQREVKTFLIRIKNELIMNTV